MQWNYRMFLFRSKNGCIRNVWSCSHFKSIGVWKVQSNSIWLLIIYLVHQTFTCGLSMHRRQVQVHGQQCYTDQIIHILLSCWWHDWLSAHFWVWQWSVNLLYNMHQYSKGMWPSPPIVVTMLCKFDMLLPHRWMDWSLQAYLCCSFEFYFCVHLLQRASEIIALKI